MSYRRGQIVNSYAGVGRISMVLHSDDPEYQHKARLMLANGKMSHWIDFSSLAPVRYDSYHRGFKRAEEVASRIGGLVVNGEHPDPVNYKGVYVWWVVLL